MELSQVVLCRGLYGEAESYLAKDGDMYVGMAVSIAQDAVELFLRAVMKDRPVAGKKIPDDFVGCMDYIDSVAPQDSNQHVPFRAKLIELNKARVNFKHYGLIPNRTDARRLLGYVADFFEDASARFFNIRFSDVSASDLLTSEDVRERLKKAEQALRDGDLEQSMGYSAEAVDVAMMALIRPLNRRSHMGSLGFGMGGADVFGRRFVDDLERHIYGVAANSERMAVMLALSVNLTDLVRFERVVPIVLRMVGGSYTWQRMNDATGLTAADATFAVNFATKFALSAQGRLANTDV
ncbi:hypothetical protein [Ralstonia mannitolilytica]|nr:hypothetical protein [Ralstonia mannitolilytica]